LLVTLVVTLIVLFYEGRVKRMEENLEGREREKRKRNIIIKGIEVREGKRREAVEEILEGIGVKVDVREIRRIGQRQREEGGRCY